MSSIICDAPATFSKLRDGSWGLRISAAVKAGQRIAVQKRDGTTQTVEIGRVLWTSDGISLCSIARERRVPARSAGYRSDRGSRAPGGRKCDYCGARDCPRAWNPRELCQED